MQIYLTELENNYRLTFPMLPESIDVQCGALFRSYDILEIGEVKFPYGESLTRISWSGKLPGNPRMGAPYITEEKDPKAVQSWWSELRKNKQKLRLLITETPINHDVYLESYTATYQGGFGDYDYTISFIEAKEIKIGTDGNLSSASALGAGSGTGRPAAGRGKTYTVVKGDCLWSIAQKMMGAGSRYPELYSANKSVIDPRNQKYNMPRYTIYPGQILTIP